MRLGCCIALAWLSACACSSAAQPSSEEPPRRPAHRAHHEPAPPPADRPEVAPLPPSTYPAPARLIAIGDVHGDLDAFVSALRAGGAIDASGHWSGGELFVVQTGDLLDRGDQEQEILDHVEQWIAEASAAGGHFLALNGNHEIMNTQGDFRYVTPGGYDDFDGFADEAVGPLYEGLPARVRGRVAAFHPGGPYARVLATHATVVRVGDTVFMHGGATAERLGAGIDAINRDARAFFLGRAPLSATLAAPDGPVWYRGFAEADDAPTCEQLDAALSVVGAHRMVIGHTKQPDGITSACDERVFRIDVGLARIYEGPIEVLEITGDATRVIRGTR